MIYTLYDIRTGNITGTTTDQRRAASEASIPGNYDTEYYYIKNNRAVKKPARPRAPEYVKYDFNLTTLTWEVNLAQTTKAARIQRAEYFKYVDKISPIWYAAMTEEQQTECIEFRQRLLDLSQQADWPLNIQWPKVPEFLRT